MLLWKILFVYYLILSLFTMGMHLWDKKQAVRGRWRVKEKSLHSFELLGGWPGALFITRTIRHKIQKPKYMWTLYSIAAFHVIGWLGLMWIATR